jgi:ribosomal protein S4
LTKSNGEGRRLVEQGGISIDDEKIEDPSLLITRDKDSFVIKKGKKVFHRIHVKSTTNPPFGGFLRTVFLFMRAPGPVPSCR